MRMRRAWTLALLWCLVAISRAIADDKPTNLSDAQAAVEANLRTPQGKAYDEQLGTEFPPKYMGYGTPVQADVGGFREFLDPDEA
jgi:hypothetical protein